MAVRGRRPEGHLELALALLPDLCDPFDGKVIIRAVQYDNRMRGVVSEEHHYSVACEDPPELRKDWRPVPQVVEDQGAYDQIETRILSERLGSPRSATKTVARSPIRRRANLAISGLMSVAITDAPWSTSRTVRGPAPQPTSSTRLPRHIAQQRDRCWALVVHVVPAPSSFSIAYGTAIVSYSLALRLPSSMASILSEP